MEDLPDSYDLIVVGTGMPECIIAAAAARVGKSVLHLDKNQYYGDLWASFNFEYLNQWVEKQKELPREPVDRMLEASWLEQLNDDERLVLLPKQVAAVQDILQKSFLEKKNVPEEQHISIPNSQQQLNAASGDSNRDVVIDNELSPTESSVPQLITSPDHAESNTQLHWDGDMPLPSSAEMPNSPEGQDNLAMTMQRVSSTDANTPAEESLEQAENLPSGAEALPASDTVSGTGASENAEPSVYRWTTEDFSYNRHKFNIDLSPKLLFSRGALVELLISSNTARYADFQSVNRILTLIDGHLEQVPCSRADVFSTKSVTVVEKRMLMKLLTFCLEYQKHPEEYRGFEGRPFIEFLRSRKITPNIEHYILHAIAMVDESCLTLQGLQATQKFMESLGRFGNSPFLWTCYGSAELPQCFCRLCAVFGGIYYLGRDVEAIILNPNNHCVGILSQGQKLKCSSLVMEYSYLPKEYHIENAPERLSRAIYITDGSILPAERQQNTFLRLPPVAGICNAVSVFEFGSLSCICPKDLYVVHMNCKSFGENVEEDFVSAENELFMPSDSKDITGAFPRKPKVLWSLHFRHFDVTMLDINSKVPTGVFATSPPGLELDFEHAVQEARQIFERLFPGEEFLPRAPDPEDIVVEDHSNPGNEEANDVTPDEGRDDDSQEATVNKEKSSSEQGSDQNTETDSHEGCLQANPEATEKEINSS